MARTKTSPDTAPSAAHAAPDPAPAPGTAPAADSPAAAVHAALAANPGSAVAVIADVAGTGKPAARAALLEMEKDGTATRIKGTKRGIPDAWTLAEPAPATSTARPQTRKRDSQPARWKPPAAQTVPPKTRRPTVPSRTALPRPATPRRRTATTPRPRPPLRPARSRRSPGRATPPAEDDHENTVPDEPDDEAAPGSDPTPGRRRRPGRRGRPGGRRRRGRRCAGPGPRHGPDRAPSPDPGCCRRGRAGADRGRGPEDRAGGPGRDLRAGCRGAAGAEGRDQRPEGPGCPARRAARQGAGPPERAPGQGVHPARDPQGAQPQLRGDRQRPGNPGQARRSRGGHREAAPVPPGRPAGRAAPEADNADSTGSAEQDGTELAGAA